MSRGRAPRGADLREALVAETLVLVEEVGLGGFNLRQLAARVGVTQPALYRHFASREALIDEVRTRGWIAFDAAACAAMPEADDPYGRLRAAALFYVAYAADNPGWFRMALSLRDVPEDAVLPSAPAPSQVAVLRALARVVPVDDPAFGPTYRAWWGLAHGLAHLVVERAFRFVGRDGDRVDAAAASIDAFVDGLRARWGAPSATGEVVPEVLMAALRRGLPAHDARSADAPEVPTS